jgi:hypothetical protein
VAPFSQPVVPPATAEYVSTLERAGAPSVAGGAPQQTVYRLFRASDGKTRMDSGNMSVITDPTAQKTTVLDHLKKQAQIMPSAPQAPPTALLQMPHVPAMPGIPGAPQPPAVHVQDLGKSFLQGQEVEGKRYTIQPTPAPPMPRIPGMPKSPQPPGMPRAPQAPGMPQMPPKPPMPVVAEVWTSSKLQLPMATKISGSFGQQTAICQKAIPGEPHPAVFEIPKDYKQLPSVPPKVPGLPKLPAR